MLGTVTALVVPLVVTEISCELIVCWIAKLPVLRSTVADAVATAHAPAATLYIVAAGSAAVSPTVPPPILNQLTFVAVHGFVGVGGTVTTIGAPAKV